MNHAPLPPNQQLVKGERWPVVGEKAPRQCDSPWTLTIDGDVSHRVVFGIDDLRAMPQTRRRIDIHCVTRWSKFAVEFEGIPLADILAACDGGPLWKDEAKFVSFIARSDRAHSTSLPLQEVLDLDPLIALRGAGQPLPCEHGGPIRMVVPGKYFYKSVKWLERIEFLTQDRLGYWESEAGYHNGADPWQEQRYIAAQLGKQAIARLLEQRDFSGLDLLSLQARGLNLDGLNATGALLRNADLREASLRGANFAEANLSNAHFHAADLREANLRDADLEGADFSAADLRGADLRGASLFGASFCSLETAGPATDLAWLDSTTLVSQVSLDALTHPQREFVASRASWHAGDPR